MEVSIASSFLTLTTSGAGGNYIAFMGFVLAWIVAIYAFSGLSSVLSSIAGIFS